MKKATLLLSLLFTLFVFAQEKTITASGSIVFEASVPLFEEVKAENQKATCVLNIDTGVISSTVYIQDFHFKIPLMEKHFNEYYIESSRYPEAVFKGTIEGFNLYIIGNEPKKFKLKGILKLHGKSKRINSIITLKKTSNGLLLLANFDVNTKDFNIQIPEILSTKVAETVNIKAKFLFNITTLANTF